MGKIKLTIDATPETHQKLTDFLSEFSEFGSYEDNMSKENTMGVITRKPCPTCNVDIIEHNQLVDELDRLRTKIKNQCQCKDGESCWCCSLLKGE